MSTLLWLRLDLRVTDNPALDAAVKRGAPVVPVFIWAPEEEGEWPPGGASKWWLHQSLAALQDRLWQAGSQLVIRRGTAFKTLRALAAETGATAVFWNRRYEPAVMARDAQVMELLRRGGLIAESFNSALWREPWTIRNKSGRPFRIFTPFWKFCLAQAAPPKPLRAPRKLSAPAGWPTSLALEELELEPRVPWAEGLRTAWQPGEKGAAARLKRFVATAFDDYPEKRNQPGVAGTSRLSPHLHFGEISPRQVWHKIRQVAARRRLSAANWRSSQFLTELGWREFAHHLLFHFPRTPIEPLRSEFKDFPWRKDASWLLAWQKGRTGFPFVDAGMRELWKTGWMHNRVRMIVGSFLVKDLLIDWKQGTRWFWDTLVDADLANNTSGWQWIAGCGADAAPYFRVFNPASQGEKFDPHGDYVRHWCPELAKLPDNWIHRPDSAPPKVLRAAGVTLGQNYPEPIVSHAIARQVALEAFSRIKRVQS